MATRRGGDTTVVRRADACSTGTLTASTSLPGGTKNLTGASASDRCLLSTTNHTRHACLREKERYSAEVGRAYHLPAGLTSRQRVYRALTVALATRHG